MRKRIVFLFLPPIGGGGAEKEMFSLAEGLLEEGFEVVLIIGCSPSIPIQLPERFPVLDLSNLSPTTRLFKLVSSLRRMHPIAIFTSFYSSGLRYSLLAKWLSSVHTKVVDIVQINLSSYLHQVNNNAPLLRRFLRRLYYQGFFRLADGFVAISKGVAEDLFRTARISKNRIFVIYGPSSTATISWQAREPVKHPFFAPSSPPVILGVGRLVPQKDFATLIKAFALVRKKRPAHLLILGEGEERQSLRALAGELGIGKDVDLPGFVANPYAYMSRASLLVLSSSFEGFGQVLVEAMACGTPVVSTDCPSGPREILDGGRYGKLVPVGDVESLAQAVLETLDNPPDKEFLRRRGREFSIERTVKQYLSLIANGVSYDRKKCNSVHP